MCRFLGVFFMQTTFDNYDKQLFFAKSYIHAFYCDLKYTEYHNHRFFELVYVVSGSAVHILDGDSRIISTGDYMIMDYNSYHEYRASNDDFAVINCLFLSKAIDSTMPESHDFPDLLKSCQFRFNKIVMGSTPANRFFHDDTGKIKLLLTEMCEECGNKETGYLDYMRSLLIQSIIITLRGISDFKINNYSPNIAKAVRMIETGYGQPLMLSDIARELYLSVPYLSIKFREETGVCFGEYLKRVRIQNACTLLNSTDMKIKDIAEKVGYNDYKRFGAIFREIVGTSPGKFRTGKTEAP